MGKKLYVGNLGYGVTDGDLTKMFERVDRGSLSQLLELFRETEPRGEYTVAIAGAGSRAARAPRSEDPNAEPDERG